MTELEWLKQESGLTDDELKAWEATLGDAKFKTFLGKIMKANETEGAARKKAETELQQFTSRYENEFVPAMRQVTQDSLKAEGETARLRAELAKAKEYGIVPEGEPAKPAEAPRAPGSPDPNMVSRDEFGKFSQSQSNVLVALNDLNAEHFGLFSTPLGNTQELVDEVNRQRTLGNRAFTLKQAWETKYNVAAKRQEAQAAAQKKHDDEVVAAALRVEREKNGANPNLRSGRTSRFSTYKASDAQGEKKPWQSPRGARERNTPWRENAKVKLREATAA
ncbi:MAG: hypothetical protein WA213_20790 [Terriglobales bacterium]